MSVHIAKLAAATFIEDDNVPGIDGVPVVTLNEGCKLRMVVTMIGTDCHRLKERAAVWIGWRYVPSRAVFANSLMVEILAVDDEEDLTPFRRKLSGFEARSSRARRVPDGSSAGGNTAAPACTEADAEGSPRSRRFGRVS